MARVRFDRVLAGLAALALAWVAPAGAEEGLYDRPVLVLDPGMHTASIRRADVDAAGEYAVTGSHDKTVRVWSVANGELLKTIRVPAGPGNVGKVYAVAIDPDGELIAAGGLMTQAIGEESVILFDRASGDLSARIDGLPEVVFHLTFSPDGRYLAATLGSGQGLRVYDREAAWAEVARDSDYGDGSYGAAFDPDGRLATTSDDGKVRLYDRSFERIAIQETSGGAKPFGIAFSPDGTRLAVGVDDSTNIEILDGETLAPLPELDTSGIDNGDLLSVAWSADGATLFAAGVYDDEDGSNRILTWAQAGAGPRHELPQANFDTVMTLAPLADGGVLVAAADPYLAVLEPDGTARWANEPAQADLRDQDKALAVSADGQIIDFGYQLMGEEQARFDLSTLSLALDPPDDGMIAPPEHDALAVDGWKNTTYPTLEGAPLRLRPYERSRSLAIHPNGDRFVLGANWSLRAYDAAGEQLWRNDVPGTVWAVNISGEGRLVVAAYGDGTIRWHRMDDGRELLAFFPLADRTNWVAWTPDGFYASTRGANRFLKWHQNRGWDQQAEAVPVSDIPQLHRPEVIRILLREMEIEKALGIVALNEARLATQQRLDSAVKPGTQLHVLGIGVGEYNDKLASHLRLEYADDDARDIVNALLDTQDGLYAKVNPQLLDNDMATRANIFRALDSMYRTMQPGDLAVVHFSGHGALVGRALYLLPYEVDARDPAAIRGTALEIGDLRSELERLAERGRVVVLLDACRSGAVSADGSDTNVDATLLRKALTGANITVLTSSTGEQN